MAEKPNVNSDQMPEVDLQRDKSSLTRAQLDYMRVIQRINAERVTKLKKLRRNNRITAGLLGLGVCGIYTYSLWAVGTEKFLDEDIEKP